MRRSVPSLAASVLVAISLSGCGGVVPPTTTASATRAPASTSAESAPAATSWTMPNLVGSGLQDAQDAIQALTSFGIAITKSHDATGAGRHQILDRDWKVCSQNVKPGATITPDTVIDFGAAKLAEPC